MYVDEKETIVSLGAKLGWMIFHLYDVSQELT
jgi:hypothetical protein